MTATEIIWATAGGICVIIVVGTLMGCLYRIIKEETRG